jgi:hypothetical protein
LGIGDPDPKYDEVEEGVEGGRYSSCTRLSEDDDGDDGDNEYNKGGGLEHMLWPPKHARPGLRRKHRGQEQAGHERMLRDDIDDEDIDREKRDDKDYSGIWEGGGFKLGIRAVLGEGDNIQHDPADGG